MTETEITARDPFTQLHIDLSDRLTNLSDYGGPADTDVIREDKGDVLVENEKKLASLGLSIVMRTPAIEATEQENGIKATVVVVAAENVTNNRSSTGTKIPALRLAAAIVAAFWHWAPAGNGWSRLKFVGLHLGEAPNEQEYELTFETQTDLVLDDQTNVPELPN